MAKMRQPALGRGRGSSSSGRGGRGSSGGGRRGATQQQKGRINLDELAAGSGSEDIDIGDGQLRMDGQGPGSDDDLADAAVYELDDDASEDEEDSEEDETDSEDVLEEAMMKGGKQAELAKQARYLEQKLKLARGEADEDDEEADEEQPGGRQQQLWGANKRAYYQDADAEDSDDEGLQEAEVRRLQAEQAAGLADDDFGLPEGTAAAAAAAGGEASLAAQLAAGGRGGVQLESVPKELGGLTDEQQLAAVMADAPELLSLLDELRGALAEVRSRVGPLLREVAGGGLATAAGLSYLEAKHLLLLQYCMAIVAYLLLKAEGRAVADHPVIGRLVQLRSYIERIRPIDKQLAYQVDKLLAVTARVAGDATAAAAAAAGGGGDEDGQAAAAGGGGDDALAHRPNPAALLAKVPLVGDAAGLDGLPSSGKYVPPKLNPLAMPEERAASNKEARRVREAQRRAQRSAVMRELAAELEGAPDEVRHELPGMDSAAAVAARQRLEARSAAEEELMLRVPLSRAEAKKLKAQRRAGLSGAAGLTDFADDVADLVAASTAAEGGRATGLSELFGKHRLSQRFGADLATQQRSQLRSGDADVAERRPLHERRAAFDAVAARRAAAAGGSDDEYEDYGSGGGRKRGRQQQQQRGGEEDEFYAASKAARSGAREAKRSAHAVPQLAPPLADPLASGARKITYEIEKNRGLTPHRRKDLKNPRKKHRVKFAEAQTRRKGQVQAVRQAPASEQAYGGEATGIKARLAKSRRL